jgi:hypothetical protein
MSFYERIGEGLARRPGLFVAILAVVTVIMFMSSQAFSATYDASSDPAGPAFEAREIIGDEFPRSIEAVPIIVEAKGKDALSQAVLSELYSNEQEFRASEIYDTFKFQGFSVELGQPIASV